MNRYGWIAAVSFMIMTVSYIISMKLTTAANAIFLQYTMPAWVLIGGALWLKESITPGRVMSVFLCLGGMVLFFLGDLKPQDWQGNLCALIAGLTFAVITLVLRKESENRPLDVVLWGNTLTAVLILPIAFLWHPEQIHILRSWQVWGGLIWLGVFQMGIAYLFYIAALKHLPAVEVAIITLIEPVLNPTWVYLGTGEEPSSWAYWGGGLIMLSVLLRSLFREAETSEAPHG